MLLANKEGIVVTGPVVNLAAAAAANAVVVFTIPILANQLIGTKSVKILKVHLFNNAVGNDTVQIGTGVAGAFAALLPLLNSINNMADFYSIEDGLPEVESFADITAFPTALPAGTIDIQLEVAVIG
jgi:hypothetical protein